MQQNNCAVEFAVCLYQVLFIACLGCETGISGVQLTAVSKNYVAPKAKKGVPLSLSMVF